MIRIVCMALALFFLSALLFPYEMDKDIDIESYFFRQRRWFFATFIVAWLLDIPETLLKGTTELRDVPAAYVYFIAVHLLIAVTGLVSENRKLHMVLPVIWLIFTLGYVLTATIVKLVAVSRCASIAGCC